MGEGEGVANALRAPHTCQGYQNVKLAFQVRVVSARGVRISRVVTDSQSSRLWRCRGAGGWAGGVPQEVVSTDALRDVINVERVPRVRATVWSADLP
ncbi:hypothetical protein BgiMline_009554, partial [Biomphalaria glabrata]